MARGTRWAAHGGMMRPFWKYNMTNKEIRKKEKGEMYYCCVGKRLSKAAAMFFFFFPSSVINDRHDQVVAFLLFSVSLSGSRRKVFPSRLNLKRASFKTSYRVLL